MTQSTIKPHHILTYGLSRIILVRWFKHVHCILRFKSQECKACNSCTLYKVKVQSLMKHIMYYWAYNSKFLESISYWLCETVSKCFPNVSDRHGRLLLSLSKMPFRHEGFLLSMLWTFLWTENFDLKYQHTQCAFLVAVAIARMNILTPKLTKNSY